MAFRITASAVAVIVSGFIAAAQAFAGGPTANIPKGPFGDGEVIVVSGSGFPTHSQDPTGLQIIECSDPQGSVANLPTDAGEGCEGITVNPSQINTDSSGRFHASYAIAALSTSAGTSSINCDATHDCVLWVGTDYNNAFLDGSHAFTTPFNVVGSAATSAPTTPAPSASGAVAGSSVATAAGPSRSTSQGSLAFTGTPGLAVWVFGLGVLSVLLGVLGRRLTVRRSGNG